MVRSPIRMVSGSENLARSYAAAVPCMPAPRIAKVFFIENSRRGPRDGAGPTTRGYLLAKKASKAISTKGGAPDSRLPRVQDATLFCDEVMKRFWNSFRSRFQPPNGTSSLHHIISSNLGHHHL